jgi:hypothetical protein
VSRSSRTIIARRLTLRSPEHLPREIRPSDVDEGDFEDDYRAMDAVEVEGDFTVRAVVVGLLVGYVSALNVV